MKSGNFILSPFTTACLFLFLCRIEVSQAVTGSSVANGNWGSTSTWSFSGVNRLPVCGDTVIIPSGRTVTVAAQSDMTGCASPIYIRVGGTLQFTNGNKLQLPCNSTVNILLGGLVKKATAGGGNSTFIEICGTIEWRAADGDLYGAIILGGNTLPISLINFQADKKEKYIALTWTTASEINNDYFTVERSTNGELYNNIGYVRGAGNSNVNLSYSFIDRMPIVGKAYYRLKQTDYDGTYSYSGTVTVKYVSKTSLDVLSVNAEGNSFKFTLDDPDGGTKLMQIISLEGRLICQTSLETRKGTDEYNIEGVSFPSGIYILQLQSLTSLSSLKFIY